MRYTGTLLALLTSSTLLASQPASIPEANPKIADISSNSASPGACCGVDAFSSPFTGLAKTAIPAVVFIKTELSNEEAYGDMPPEAPQSPYNAPFGNDLFNRFFGFPFGKPQQQQPVVSQGSGFLISSDGYIMTNAHVVKGAEKIEVTLNDGQVLKATLIGTDFHTDVAIIKIDGSNFPFLPLGDSDALEIGEWVVAIGSPFQLSASLTAGVVSAKGRQGLNITDYEDFIQTDAAINPGNSGGPLLNLKKEVIAINTAIFSRNGGYMGIGFAVPSNMARGVMEQLMKSGSVTRGFIGISMQPVDKEIAAGFNLDKVEGILVSDVSKGSPAEKAGLKQGDIILEYNGKPIKNYQMFRNDIAMMQPGATVSLKINRKGTLLTVPITLGSLPGNVDSPSLLNQKLGIEVDALSPDMAKQLGYSPDEKGVVITKIKPGSIAAAAGLRPGFLIAAVNHTPVSSLDDYANATVDAGKNPRVLLLVRQGKLTRFYSIRLE